MTKMNSIMESLFQRSYVSNRIDFLRESVEDTNMARFNFCLQEASKASNMSVRFSVVMEVLGGVTKTYERDLKNRIEKSNDKVIRDIFKSNGDIDKVEIVSQIYRLLTTSIEINNRMLADFKRTRNVRLYDADLMEDYNKQATKFLIIIKLMRDTKRQWMKAINNEMHKPFEKQFNRQFYLNIIIYLEIFANALYSLSLRLRNATTFYFVYDSVDSGMGTMNESMRIVDDIIVTLRNPLFFSDKVSHLKEHFSEAQGKDFVLTEGFLDVIAGLLTNTSVGQFLMLPVYLIRTVTYLVLYLGATYSAISNSISNHLAQLKGNATEGEKRQYIDQSRDLAYKSLNQLENTQMAIKHEVNDNKDALRQVAVEPNTTQTHNEPVAMML